MNLQTKVMKPYQGTMPMIKETRFAWLPRRKYRHGEKQKGCVWLEKYVYTYRWFHYGEITLDVCTMEEDFLNSLES